VAEAVVRLCQVLHVDTVAEGIEHLAQADALTRLGCQAGQGNHFGEPMTAEQVGALLVQAVRAWPTLPAMAVPQVGGDGSAVGSDAA
jgi:EAL domain-containing protein (putative c-di-GMP-specific phosphodiesterase class I)